MRTPLPSALWSIPSMSGLGVISEGPGGGLSARVRAVFAVVAGGPPGGRSWVGALSWESVSGGVFVVMEGSLFGGVALVETAATEESMTATVVAGDAAGR